MAKYNFKELLIKYKGKPLPEDCNEHIEKVFKDYPLAVDMVAEYRKHKWHTGKASEKATLLMPGTFLPRATFEIHAGIVKQCCMYKYNKDADGDVGTITVYNIFNETTSFKNKTHKRGDV